MITVADRRQSKGAAALADALRVHPVIASVRDEDRLPEAIASHCRAIFLLSTSIQRLSAVGDAVAAAGKLLFIHLDFIGGLGRDEEALEYLAETARPLGLITTRTGLVQAARRLGLTPLQRLFLLDSQSLATGIEAARSSRAEVVEVLPGIVPRAVGAIRAQLPHTLIIAGGLVRTPEEVAQALRAGASGVSTSSAALWHLDPAAFEGPFRSDP
ncbi:MAG: glycerol-3-phosphate responsive antiterminator [Symbiobacterium sp.]|uniref:glycerol-3-phosphate responsive antiterminator n=1 Tax=Symbiobacterium sp. TaxID=1971213 RepID=UPI003463D65B